MSKSFEENIMELEQIVSKLENGNSNPTLGMLKRLADGMGMTVKLQFVPKQIR